MTRPSRTQLAAGIAGAAIAATGLVVANVAGVSSSSSTTTETIAVPAEFLTTDAQPPAPPDGCNNWAGTWTPRECAGAGFILSALQNVTLAKVFCTWVKGSPGEWSRLKGYASSGIPPMNIASAYGVSLWDEMQAYFGAGGPVPLLLYQTPPATNSCGV